MARDRSTAIGGVLRSLRHRSWSIGPLFVAVIALVPVLSGDIYHQRQLMLIAVYTLIVSGLNISFGYGGELALGQVAMFATGAYVTGYLANDGHSDIVLALASSIIAAGMLGVISGVPGIRLSGWSLAMTSFFLVLLIPKVAELMRDQTGGLLGLPVIETPTVLGVELNATGLYVFTAAVVFVWLVVARNMIVSRFGARLRVLRESPLLTQSLGASTYRTRMSAYLIGSLPAGAAGCIFAYLNSYISPDAFTLSLMIALLAASVVGGSDSVWGAPVGAAILVLGPLQTSGFERYSVLLYGIFLLVVGVLFSSGLAGLGRKIVGRLAPPQTVSARVDPAGGEDQVHTIAGGTLEVRGVSRAFGGVHAISGVDFDAHPGQVTAIMGANGAGKTTLLNVISGFIATDGGAIAIDGKRVDGMPAHRVANLGVKRTFQTPLIPSDMTALEIAESGRLAVGRVGILATLLRLPSFRRVRDHDRQAAIEALDFAGLRQFANEEAKQLPLGTRRLLEVVRAVASRPRVLLLDEPAAGLDDVSLAELRMLIDRARGAGATIILVEHNVRFLLDTADRVFVMERGEVIASGTPQEVRGDAAVLAAYFGKTAVDDVAAPQNMLNGSSEGVHR
ncbi:ATP-binding cassette domain-containing protein [Nocardioides sp. NPDC051685]|uniref:branched-chain amino acid ABC transporter ATP-binding protein/permease n=1 Tax=Nocardioides sp. NPDC051685 TaxID=3364334 RepID=UPI0037A5F8D0